MSEHSLEKSISVGYIVIAYIIFALLLFLINWSIGGLFKSSSIVTLTAYTLFATAASALVTLPIRGAYNRIKKYPYLYKWTNTFLYASVSFFLLSPLLIYFLV
ncbi:hypothetical protein MNB_SV-8-175 [hydrothermal vent metagenome]|uniref:Uncharacterized protein n=1 Tax=hydrothermal vent metagenome TaxID=652676 RepID=A0A1W1CB17_9ZZZZ